MELTAKFFEKELLENVVPFWTRHCPDKEHGAYFTCLDRDGSIFDTEKFMWMQWRIVWMLAELCHRVERRPEWLELARNGYEFLTRHGKDAQGRYYFSLRRDGVPTSAPHSAFSECFASMGSAALFRITGEAAHRLEATSAFHQYVARHANPKGEWSKQMPGARPYHSLAFPMIKINLALVMAECLGETGYDDDIRSAIRFVLASFWNEERRIMFENVPVEGGFDLNSMTGRHLNPGHVLEAMWFIMQAAERVGDRQAAEQAADIALATLEYGWDKEYGGLYYFMDALGKPHIELQANMKLWWVHCEAIVAALMAHRLTGDKRFQVWFERLCEWSWQHFDDPEHGEWYGYLDRRGEPASLQKGGKWKSFFHLPRMLLRCRMVMDCDR